MRSVTTLSDPFVHSLEQVFFSGIAAVFFWVIELDLTIHPFPVLSDEVLVWMPLKISLQDSGSEQCVSLMDPSNLRIEEF